MDKQGYSYLIQLKTLWEKEKLLIVSNFSFSHNVFKSCLLLMHQNGYLCNKGLNCLFLSKHQQGLLNHIQRQAPLFVKTACGK